jgi:hypothetical protein
MTRGATIRYVVPPFHRDQLLASYKPDTTPRQRVPGDHLWTPARGDQRLSCELRTTPDIGVEAQLFRNDELLKGRLFRDRGGALAHADSCRTALEADGWRSADTSGS